MSQREPNMGLNGSPTKQGVPATRRVRFRVRRQDSRSAHPRWESFEVNAEPGANIISCLQQIATRPVTITGERSTPVAYDANCLEEICGACTMVINGRVRQSCSCLIDQIAPNAGDTITLEPMSKFPVIRDLWVDRQRVFRALERIRAWVPIDSIYDRGPGPRELPAKQEPRYELSTCMSCACCLEACPQFNIEPDESKWDTSFIGAHAISQARLFNDHHTAKQLKGLRLDALLAPGGISDCGNAQNCVKVCPKEIPLTESIATIGRAVTVHSIARWFTGG